MGKTVEQRMRQTDAFAWGMERDPLLRSTIVAVARFDRAPDWDALVDRIDRATRITPTFRQRLVVSPLKLAPPRFEVDPDFELSWHIRRVSAPPPHTFGTVLDIGRTAGMAAFDPARPLWEFTLVDGLEGGSAALVMKVHHSLTDGIGGIQVARHVVDLAPEPEELGPMPEAPVPRDDHGLPPALIELVDAITYDVGHLVAIGGRAVLALPGETVRTLRDPLGTFTGAVRGAASVGRFVRPITSTQSPVMTARRLSWQYDALCFSLPDLKRAAHMVGGTLNDAFLAGVTGGLRRYHEAMGAEVEALRLTMPISTRQEGDPEGGNRVTLARFEVPVGISDPMRRMTEIGRACAAQREEEAIPWSNTIAAVLNLLPSGAVGGMLKHVDFLASNVPGLPATVWVAGARLEGFYAFGPTIGASANVTLMSYDDECFIGVNMDTGAVTDPTLFVDSQAAGFEEVLDVAGDHTAVRFPVRESASGVTPRQA